MENDEHCDFKKLRSLLIRTHMHDLIATTEEIHYETYRTNRLKQSADLSIDPNAMSKYLSTQYSFMLAHQYAVESGRSLNTK